MDTIVIPDLPIGAPGWDAEISPIIQGYAKYMAKRMPSPASTTDMENCEKRLGTTLPDDLRLFYLTFGNSSLMDVLLPVTKFYYISASWSESFLSRFTLLFRSRFEAKYQWHVRPLR